MAALSDYQRAHELNALLAPPVYVALYTTTIDATDTATECTDATYTRQVIAFHTAVPPANSVTNNADVTWAALSTGQTILAIGLRDAFVGGNLKTWENLGSPNVFIAGDQPNIPDDALTVQAV